MSLPRQFVVITCCLAHALGLIAEEPQVAQGLTVKPAVADGLLTHPFAGTLDYRGRLFVSDQDSIVRLEDTDHDGIFDESIPFVENLHHPQGLIWVDDSLYVLDPPTLWKFTDGDGNGLLEGHEELVTGFSEQKDLTGSHGPFLHPNGRIYWTQGRRRFAIPDPDTQQIMHSGDSARIWFCQITGSDVHTFAGGGMDDPTELDFTDAGEILGVSNVFYGRPRGDTIAHWIYQGTYPRRDQSHALSELPRTGDLLPAAHNFGTTTVTGFLRYRSGHLKKNWKNHWFTAHRDGSRVTRTRLIPNQATFEAAETETVLHLSDPDARITDLLEDHNGDLLVFSQGDWTPELTNDSGPRGTIYRIAREGIPHQSPAYLDWEKLTSEEVANLLMAEESWVRSKAITELAVRGAPAIPELRRLLSHASSPPHVRVNAIWALARMRFSESVDMVYEALTDPNPKVRQAACNAMSVTRSWQTIAANQPAELTIELARNQTISGALARIVRSDEPSVARSAAVALGRMGESRAIGAILGRLGRVENDRFLEHSLIFAMIEIDDYASVHSALDSENARVLNGVIWALQEMPSSEIEIFDILPLLEIPDTGLRESIISISANHPNWDAGLANRFFEWMGDMDEHREATLELMIPQMATSPPITDFLTALTLDEDPAHQSLAIKLIALSPNLQLESEWIELVQQCLSEETTPVDLENALNIAGENPMPEFETQIMKLSESETAAPQFRERAGELLDMLKSSPKAPENAP